jgi:WD40 repeat protein/serine/threonine protein kinase
VRGADRSRGTGLAVKAGSGESVGGLAQHEIRTCMVCRTKFSAIGDGECCPVCLLRGASGGEREAKESIDPEFARGPDEPKPLTGPGRFEKYDLVRSEDGTPVELGRGAMGITYKAVDVDLRCLVTLKVISERYLRDETARLRFLREARAAASLRHPNVASIFHLGRSGGNYFYAMEFVEGETLENLIRRSHRLEVTLALEIATQIAAGLAAVHKQNLVHRDIKPSNIMVSSVDGGALAVKIIDLGLAKAVNESPSETPISTPGAFAGTPEVASPEQFAGLGVDIRSDLYSLGVTLWAMLTGQAPFRGSPAEVMYQHQHAPLPLEQLEGVPQPVVVLLELLLQKDSARRFQSPAEVLKAMRTVNGAISGGRPVRKTIRVFVSSTADVQKERNLADRVIRSVAAEFNLPISAAYSNSERLTEESYGPQTELEDQGRLILCPYYWEYHRSRPDSFHDGKVPNTAEFDLVVCILWSHLGALPVQPLRLPDGSRPRSGTEYEMVWAVDHAKKNRGVPALHVYRNCSKPAPPLEPGADWEAFGQQWDLLKEFFSDWEKNGAGGFSGTCSNYQNLEEFEECFREQMRAFLADQITREVGQKVLTTKKRRWDSSPFRGLDVFDFEHSPIFCGRTKAVGEILQALEEQIRADRPFVLVVGASGSGKSSLIRAGVLPLLTQRESIEGIGLWRRAVTRPGAGGGGADCFDSLAVALLEPAALPGLADSKSSNAIHDLATELREDSDSVACRVQEALDLAAWEWEIQQRNDLEGKERQLRESERTADADFARQQLERLARTKARLVLVVDQLEELFTTGYSPEIRQKYVSSVGGLVRSGRVFVLATLRSDFYSSYQKFPDLIELAKGAGKFDLGPPTPSEIGNIIRLPGEAAGLRFEQDRVTHQRLDEALRDAASSTPAALPLLEHVLTLLYDAQSARGDGLLRWSDYRELGELKGALAKHAELVFSALQPDEQKAFSLVMRHLVTLEESGEEVPNRRSAPYHDFVVSEGSGHQENAGAKGFVDLFIEKRLLVAGANPDGQVCVSVAHEALLCEWQRVKEWLTENRKFLGMRDRLDSSMRLWLSRGRLKDDLLGPGFPLAEGEKLLADFGPSLNGEQTEYVRASVAEQKRRKRGQERIRYSVLVAISILAIAAGFQWLQADRQRGRAEQNAQLAQSNEARSKDLLREASKVDFAAATQQKDSAAKLAYLARAVRNDPGNRAAAITLEQLITREALFPNALLRSFPHDQSVVTASFSPDAKWVVTASDDHTARVWDVATGQEVGQPLQHESRVNTATFSPDGKSVVTASADHTARVWEAATGKAIGEPLRHDSRVNSASFSPDGKWVVTASEDSTARVWEMATGQAVGKPLRHDGFVYTAGFSSDGKWVVTTSSDHTARIWEAATGNPVGQPLQHDQDVWSAAFSPDGKLVVTASSDRTARIWELMTGKAVAEPLRHEGGVNTALFSPDGEWVVTASEDHTARVWEAATGKPVSQPLRHEGGVNNAAFSPDGIWIVTSSQDRTACIWESASGKLVGQPLRHESIVNGASFSPDGNRIVTASAGRAALVWNATNGGAARQPLRHDGNVTNAAFSPDGKWVITTSSDHTSRVWQVATGEAIGQPLQQNGSVNAAGYSPDGKLVVTGSADGTAQVWEAATGKLTGQTLVHHGGVSSVIFSPDGKWIATASWDASARVWETATGKPVCPPLRHDASVYGVAFSPDGKWVVTASADRTARIWEAATGKPVGKPLRHDGYVLDSSFSPDGKWVVTASADGTARIWVATTGNAVSQPLRHSDSVRRAAFSPDGRWVVTASADGTAQMWDAGTGKAFGKALRHEGAVSSAAFSPDGKWVVTASADGTARVWEAETSRPVGEPLQHERGVLQAIFSPDGRWVVTTSSDHTARIWEAPSKETLSEAPTNLIKLLPALIGHLDFDEDGFLKLVPNSRVLECRDEVCRELKKTGLIVSSLAARIEWLLAEQRTRSVNPTSSLTVPTSILSTINWVRKVSRKGRNLATSSEKSVLEKTYSVDPAFPLLHLALSSVEGDAASAAFLRDFDLRRLPQSCRYTSDLDPGEITLQAAEMCAEQNDWPRVLIALDKYAKFGNPNPRSEALRAQAEKVLSPVTHD